MRRNRSIVFAILAVLLCMNFTACQYDPISKNPTSQNITLSSNSIKGNSVSSHLSISSNQNKDSSNEVVSNQNIIQSTNSANTNSVSSHLSITSNQNKDSSNEIVSKKSFYGKWKIVKIIEYGKVTESDGKDKLNKVITISNGGIAYENKEYSSMDWQLETITENDFYMLGYVYPENLGLKDPIISLSSNNHNIDDEIVPNTFYFKDDSTIILSNQGVYFALTKTDVSN